MERDERNEKETPKAGAAARIKEDQIRALEKLGDQLRQLIAVQKNAVERVRLLEDSTPVHLERLSDYDRFMPLLVASFGALGDAILAKHPGGAPANKFRQLAFDVLTSRYINDQVVLSAKQLVKAVAARLPKGSLDADASGKEPFSERVATSVVREFRACLRIHPDHWN